jgi:hypothetical protein
LRGKTRAAAKRLRASAKGGATAGGAIAVAGFGAASGFAPIFTRVVASAVARAPHPFGELAAHRIEHAAEFAFTQATVVVIVVPFDHVANASIDCVARSAVTFTTAAFASTCLPTFATAFITAAAWSTIRFARRAIGIALGTGGTAPAAAFETAEAAKPTAETAAALGERRCHCQ